MYLSRQNFFTLNLLFCLFTYIICCMTG